LRAIEAQIELAERIEHFQKTGKLWSSTHRAAHALDLEMLVELGFCKGIETIRGTSPEGRRRAAADLSTTCRRTPSCSSTNRRHHRALEA